MDNIAIQFKKWRLLIFLLGFTFWIFVGISFFFGGFADGDFGLSVIGLVIFMIIRKPLIFTFNVFTKDIPALIINENGVTDNTFFFSVGEIKWEDIKEIKTVRFFFFYKFIRIILYNPNIYIKRQNLRKRIHLTILKFTQKTPVVLDHRLMVITFKELTKIFNDINLDGPGFTDLSKHLIE